MLDGLKPYPAYKESGVPWLGRIPENWSVARNGRLFSRRNEPGTADLPILEVSLRTGVRVRELGGGGRKQLMADIAGYRRAVHGDIAYNTMRMWQGAVGVVPTTGLVSPAYVVARPHVDAVARYFTHLFRTGAYLEQIDGYSRGIVKDRNRLYWEDFKRIPSLVPPPEVQLAIVRFLDHAERRARRYIRARNRLLELIKERKATLIAAVMTKGLNPTARQKASGLLWLGEIPEGWTLKRSKVLARIRSGQVDPREPRHRARVLIAPNHIGKGSGHIVHLQTAEEQGADSGKYEVRRGEIIYSKIRPALRKAAIAPVDCLCSADMYPITVDGREIRPEFFLRILLSEPFTRYAVDSSLRVAMPKVNREALGDFWLWYPALEAQDEIIHFIGTSSELPDLAVTRVELEIGLVRELHARLVTDVVTGKLDVREAAAKLPEETIGPDATEYDQVETAAEDDPDDEPAADSVGSEA